jgi:CrcB protein
MDHEMTLSSRERTIRVTIVSAEGEWSGSRLRRAARWVQWRVTGVNVLVHGRWPMMRFPLATFVVNVAGCLVIGVLAGLIMSGRITPRLYWREFVFVGILGGFTTFSTFGLDTITLARTQSMTPAVWNVIGQVALGLLAVQAGILLVTSKSEKWKVRHLLTYLSTC